MAYDKVVDSGVLDGNLLSIANAIREKAELTENFTFPQGFIEAISGIKSSGNMRIETGTVTLSEDAKSYTFLNELADFFIMFSANTDKPIHTDRKGVVAMIWKSTSPNNNEYWMFGYNEGTYKYYQPYYVKNTNQSFYSIRFTPSLFNGSLVASGSPYVWVAIWGCNIETL